MAVGGPQNGRFFLTPSLVKSYRNALAAFSPGSHTVSYSKVSKLYYRRLRDFLIAITQCPNVFYPSLRHFAHVLCCCAYDHNRYACSVGKLQSNHPVLYSDLMRPYPYSPGLRSVSNGFDQCELNAQSSQSCATSAHR